jgi:hypothetical protein
MERGAGSEQGSPESEMGDGDNDSVGYGAEMEVDAVNSSAGATPASSASASVSASAYAARARAYDGVDPFEGMEFDDEEDAWTFYNVYAHRVGFSTRISVMHRSRRDGTVMSRQFVCAKEGFRTYRSKNDVARADAGTGDEDSGRGRRMRAVTRVGCKAMIRVKKQDNGGWAVTKLETAHNHPLIPADQSHCLRPHKPLSECGKQKPFGGHRNGGTPMVIESPSTPFTPPMHRTGLPQVVPQGISDGIGSGTRVILDYVKRMQAEDPAFFYAMQFVDGHPVGNVFWADARGRMAYKDFGDAVVLDDYCKRSKHELPLVTFSGVNHHYQPILFGCAIVSDNSEASFVWLFETFLLAMSGKHPASLTVEHDNAAPSAASKVFTRTRLRFCKWHIMNEVQDKFSHLLNAFPSFHEELTNCVDMSETVDEFKANWKVLISKVGSPNSEWLDSLYNCRHQWVPLYLRDTFFGDVSLRQQCASRSFLFEGYISAKTDSQSFIQQYEKALDCCYEKEVKEEFETKYSLPDIKTSSPIEKQGAEVYTKSVFLKFQQELIDASVCTAEAVKEEGNVSIYKVIKSGGSEKPSTVHFSSSENSATCSCQMFEHFGIICKHILAVFAARGVSALPAQYFVKRWTKNAMDRSSSEKVDEISRVQEPKEDQRNSTEDGVHSPTWRYNSLCREALRYAEEGSSSLEVYIVAMQALQEAANRVNMAKRGIGQVAPLAVMPIAAQPPESFGQVQDTSSSKQKKRRSSNNSKENFTLNQLMYVQQPVNFLCIPGSSSALPGPSHLVAAAPVSLSTQYGQTSGANDNDTPVDKFSGFPHQNASAPSSGNVQGGETKSKTAAQIKEVIYHNLPMNFMVCIFFNVLFLSVLTYLLLARKVTYMGIIAQVLKLFSFMGDV